MTAYYTRLKILHIEDDVAVASLVKRMLAVVKFAGVQITLVPTLEDGITQLYQDGTWDVILLDLNLPDSEGMNTFHMVHGSTDVPIVVLTADDNLEQRAEVVGLGAQDCVYKLEMTPDVLIRSLRFAVERNRTIKELRVALRELEAANRAMRIMLDQSGDGQ